MDYPVLCAICRREINPTESKPIICNQCGMIWRTGSKYLFAPSIIGEPTAFTDCRAALSQRGITWTTFR